MNRLDRTEQRIVGVLIEKQLSVPDSYPLSENALVDGCNQKSNRDPAMELATFQVGGALMALQEKGFVAKVEGGGRVARYRHLVVDKLGVDAKDLPVLAELLLRGPQAPGALKPRVARMGLSASPEMLEAVLHRLAQHAPPLVELLPLRPRERDRRWRHLLGDAEAAQTTPVAAVDSVGAALPTPAPSPAPRDALLEVRVAALEQRVAALQELVQQLKPRGENG
ncbi:MAG: DUF480 domain-containing protein [Planctomycetes bacterium]|nr:DUF480 domain-containing protein [Planctomycetota bacterium]